MCLVLRLHCLPSHLQNELHDWAASCAWNQRSRLRPYRSSMCFFCVASQSASVERVVAHDRSYYATGECKQAVAGRVRQVVVDGRDFSMRNQSVLSKVVVNARWSSMAGVAQNRFYCTCNYHLIQQSCCHLIYWTTANYFFFSYACHLP